MKRIYATILLTALVGFIGLGGCKVGEPDRGDAGVQENDYCTQKVVNCQNACYKAGMGLMCRLCCERNGISCDTDGGYQFNSCLDTE